MYIYIYILDNFCCYFVPLYHFWGKVCFAPLKCGTKYEGSMNLRGKFAPRIHGAMQTMPAKLEINTDFAP